MGKKQGLLLSKAEREKKARAEAMLEAMRAQGVDVPAIGEKRPKPGTRKRMNQQKMKHQQQEQEVTKEEEDEDDKSKEEDSKVEETEEESKEAKDDVVEAWDAEDEVKD